MVLKLEPNICHLESHFGKIDMATLEDHLFRFARFYACLSHDGLSKSNYKLRLCNWDIDEAKFVLPSRRSMFSCNILLTFLTRRLCTFLSFSFFIRLPETLSCIWWGRLVGHLVIIVSMLWHHSHNHFKRYKTAYNIL